MIRVLGMIVILRRKVRELPIMIRNEPNGWFTETNACTVLSQPCTYLFLEMSQIPSSAHRLLSSFETRLPPFSKVSRRPISRDSLLESESQFLAVNDPTQMLPIEQMSLRPKQSSARERRRWKQLEEMARNPKVKLFSFPRLSCKLLE